MHEQAVEEPEGIALDCARVRHNAGMVPGVMTVGVLAALARARNEGCFRAGRRTLTRHRVAIVSRGAAVGGWADGGGQRSFQAGSSIGKRRRAATGKPCVLVRPEPVLPHSLCVRRSPWESGPTRLLRVASPLELIARKGGEAHGGMASES